MERPLGTEVRNSSEGRRLIRAGISALLLAICLAAFLHESWGVSPQLDDAYISYRYARNLVEGQGLVYNLGEYVEGFTNLLWTLLVAGGLALGFEANAVGHGLGLASGAALLLVTFAYARVGLSTSQVWMAAFAPWLVLSSLPFAFWATSGMETPLFAAMATAALAAHASGRVGWATIVAFGATLTRPEGALVGAIVLGFHLFSSWRRVGWRSLRWPLVYALLVGVLTAFRMAYYGSPVPNTFYAKVEGVSLGRGIAYLLAFLGGGAWLLLVPALAALRDRRWWPGAVFTAVLTLYVVAIGGDAFPHSRFLLPVLPLVAAMGVSGAVGVSKRNRRAGFFVWACIPATLAWNVLGLDAWGIVLALALLAGAGALAAGSERRWIVAAAAVGLAGTAAASVFMASPSPLGALRDPAHATKHARMLDEARERYRRIELRGMRQAEILNRREEPVGLVAAGAIGSFGYYSRLTILDIWGLVDPVIAGSSDEPRPQQPGLFHCILRMDTVCLRGWVKLFEVGWALLLDKPGHRSTNVDYIFERRPDYILIPRHKLFLLTRPAFRAILKHPDLDLYYEWDDELRGFRRRTEPHTG